MSNKIPGRLPPIWLLKKLFDYNPETGDITKKGTNIKMGKSGAEGRYMKMWVKGAMYFNHRIAYAMYYDKDPYPHNIDHIDNNRLNNSIKNLRLDEENRNLQNCKIRKTNSSGYQGVTWDKNKKKWAAQISYMGKNYFLGVFRTPEEAYEAYLLGSQALHKDWGHKAKVER